MKNQAFVFLAVGLFVGIGSTALAMGRMQSTATVSSSRNASNSPTDAMAGMDMSSPAPSGSSMSMADMTANLSGKAGDDFDKAFLSEMIAHHQGAVDMAKLASTQAKHQEVKDLANNIIAAQTSEIARMEQWQKSWGYAE